MEINHQIVDGQTDGVLSSNDHEAEVLLLRIQNQKLQQQLEALVSLQQHDGSAKIADILAQKDGLIEALKQEVESLKKEREALKYELSLANSDIVKYKPVANPLQTALVNYLISVDVISSCEVEEVMRSIDRGDFAPKDAYIDAPQLIGFNTTVSAPHMHALQLELLKDCFKGAKRALDIGTGSGYMALAMAKMMRDDDVKVYGIDHIPKLIEQARENISKNHADYLSSDKIEFLVADGREGLAQYAPFDIILVGGSVKQLPEEFIEQLALGGSMLVPIGEHTQKLVVVHKTKDGTVLKTPVMSVGFGKLQSVEEQCPDIDE